MNPRFYFSTCQIGAEKAVKAEVMAEFPQLRFAFSRPGFITFKEENSESAPITLLPGVFTRLWGVVLGQAKDLASLKILLETEMKKNPKVRVLHAFERDLFVPGDEPKGFEENVSVKKLLNELPLLTEANLKINSSPKNNEEVFDLIWIDDFHVFLGLHVHSPAYEPAPGNRPAIEMPKTSPSRAYLKIVEAMQRFRPTIEPGMQVLEVGCSPGGATLAMLARELEVTGVDPKRMDAQLDREKNFHFIQKMAKNVTREDLHEVNPSWIVMDMNIVPLEALDELAHIVNCLRKNFRNDLRLEKGLLTIKLNDWKFAESIPLYLRRLEDIGFRDLIPTQLCSNRQEFFVMANGFEI